MSAPYLSFERAMKNLATGLPAHPDAGFLGARFDPELALLQILPVAWDATSSYGTGAAKAPEAIRKASHQLDLEDRILGDAYRAGIALLPTISDIDKHNRQARQAAQKVIDAIEHGSVDTSSLAKVNQQSAWLNQQVYESCKMILQKGKYPAVLGGEHSVALGLIQALETVHPGGFGILQIDAHFDLRKAYEGFTWSHASLFFNVLESVSAVKHIVQVGIRDYSREEKNYAQLLISQGRGSVFYAGEIFSALAKGECFHNISSKILAALPEKVYISLDIDGLDPVCCPGTGTPVPGGLEYLQLVYILENLARSGRKIIGFDLSEVAPGKQDEWDANVGARVLYKLCAALLHSQEYC